MNEARILVEDTNLTAPEVPEHAPCSDSNPGASPAMEIPEEPIRLQELLSQAGVASWRASEDLIKRGRAQVDGETVTETGLKVLPSVCITVNGQRTHTDAVLQVRAFNKSVGTVSTIQPEDDRSCLGDWVTKLPQHMFHVRRLDVTTSGLVLLTNNSDLANRLVRPRHEAPKTYVTMVQDRAKPGLDKALRQGVELEDGVAKVDTFKLVEVRRGSSVVRLTLHSGKNRVVCRLLSEAGHSVSALIRTVIGTLRLGDLKESHSRLLTGFDLVELQEMVGLQS